LGYYLTAVLGAEQIVSGVAERLPGSVSVPLAEGMALVPLPNFGGERGWLLTHSGNTRVPLAERVPQRLQMLLVRLSESQPIAYVEAAFFGGEGEQAAIVWDRGSIVLGPVVEDEDNPPPLSERAINQALRRLGIGRRGHAIDEFATVGLGRHRTTEAWVALAGAEGLEPPAYGFGDRRSTN
jgi:hypothetical protein